MRLLFLFICIITNNFLFAQADEVKLTNTLKEFHKDMVKKNTVSLNQQTDKALSYGHSNGLVETKNDFLKNLETGYMSYNSYKEDSLQININGNMANVRFVADINVELNGIPGNYHLKVLEVWVNKGSKWILFARQAVK